jgi:hypothetical protein
MSVSIAPKAPIGTASNTEKGTDQLSYNAARKRKTKVNENKKDVNSLRCLPELPHSSILRSHNHIPVVALSLQYLSVRCIAWPLL